MAVEFHNLNLQCDPASVVPSGSSYTDTQYQSCAGAGSQPGMLTINGDAYLESSYGFYYHNVWRNFGILMLFTVAFIALSALLTEIIEWSDKSTGAVTYGGKRRRHRATPHDEGNKADDTDYTAPSQLTDTSHRDITPVYQTQKTTPVLTWRSLNYTIQTGGSERVLLNDVSGYCRPCELIALVGSSGAGKSTRKFVLTHKVLVADPTNLCFPYVVLSILTQRQRVGKLSGELMVNGQPVDDAFHRQIGYCQQADIHDNTSTIKEAFEFSALMRQNSDVPNQEKLEYVNTVLDTLGLTDLENAVIGSLPLEQKRRTTIGVELCARPSLLLFLDEPTSVSCYISTFPKLRITQSKPSVTGTR